MGQKNNPILLRLASSTKSFDNSWYSDYNYTKLLSMDLSIHTYINNFFQFLKLPSTRLSIQHLPKTTKLYIFFCYPQKSREIKSKAFQISSSLFSFENVKQTQSINLLYHDKIANSLVNNKNKDLCLSIQDYKKKKTTPIYFNSSNNYTSNQFYELQKMNNFLIKANLLKDTHYMKSTSSNSDDTAFKIEYTKLLLFFNILMKKKDFIYLSKINLQVKNFFTSFFKLIKRNDFKKYLYFESKSQLTKLDKNLLFFLYLKNATNFKQIINIKNKTDDSNYKIYLESSLSNYYKFNIQLVPFNINNEWQSANYFADEIVYLIERRISFRRIKNFLLKQITQNPKIRGIRILCSGRVGGKSKKSQRAKIESFKYGQTSLHVFSSKLDFAIRTAYTPLGTTGVKVWICYN